MTGYLTAACAVLLAGCVLLWNLYDAADDRADRAESALKTEAANAKIVTEYVDRIVKVPGPTVVRERLVHRVCNASGVPSPGGTDGATGADSSDRRADPAGDLAADLPACQRNKMKLEALHAVLRPQL